jgi:hypothetical protein
MMDDDLEIPELTEEQFASAIPACVHWRLVLGHEAGFIRRP